MLSIEVSRDQVLSVWLGITSDLRVSHPLQNSDRGQNVRSVHRSQISNTCLCQTTRKLTPWQLQHFDTIGQYTTDIGYVPGAENIPADIMSQIEQISAPWTINYEEWAKAQQIDQKLQTLLQKQQTSLSLKHVEIPGTNVKLHYDAANGRLRRKVPVQFRASAFKMVHQLAHGGACSTIKPM